MDKTLNSKIRGTLYGLFIGDALAMPVHWYYDRDALKRVSLPIQTLVGIMPIERLGTGCFSWR